MGPDTLAVLIPIVAIGGFFALMIVRTFTKAYTAKLQAGSQVGPALEARQEELAARQGRKSWRRRWSSCAARWRNSRSG